jgi:ABC-type multidrug transport system fused ATPase/permease subunit
MHSMHSLSRACAVTLILFTVPATDAIASPFLRERRPLAVNVRASAAVAVAATAAATDAAATADAAATSAAPPRRNEWRTLFSLCRPDFALYVLAFAAMTFAALGDALLPQLQAAALNTILLESGGATVSALHRLGLVGVGTALATGLRGFVFWLCGVQLTARLRRALFSGLMWKPQAFYDGQPVGALSSRLANDCTKLGDVLSLNINILLRQALQAACGMAVVARLNGKLAALIAAGVIARAAFSAVYARFNRRIAKAQTDAQAASAAVADECLKLIETVRACGTEEEEADRYATKLQKLVNLQGRQGAMYGASRVVTGSLNTGQLVGVLALAAALTQAGVLPRAMATSFVLYSEFIGSATADIADQWSRVQEALGAATEVFSLLPTDDEAAAIDEERAAAAAERADAAPADATAAAAAAAAAADARGRVAFDGVGFSYPARPDVAVLDGLDLAVSPGERVAVLGSSGSGKSTILALLLRFYNPAAGRITLDGDSLAELSAAELRRRVAVVPQEPPLLSGSIRSNIAYGVEASDAEVEAAARQANCHDFITTLPDGYATAVGQNALSGGQKQRIAIARALVRDPDLLLLDEATSALDPESERLVEDALRRASADRTVLLTTHSLRFARQLAERIVVMRKGELVEQGTHEQLLARNGEYAALVRAAEQGGERGDADEPCSPDNIDGCGLP